MARFQGNIQAGSDRAAATLLFVVLVLVLIFGAWAWLDPVGFANTWNSVAEWFDRD